MSELKYKVGDRVLIKSLDWYNENKNEYGDVWLMTTTHSKYNFLEPQSDFCGKVVTIEEVYRNFYTITDPETDFYWTDEMIECKVEEETKTWTDVSIPDDPFTVTYGPPSMNDSMNKNNIDNGIIILPEGYIFKDENGNVINATKIVLEKKKEYSKTYEECAKIMNCPIAGPSGWLFNFDANIKDPYYRKIDILMGKFTRLLICRDAYWKLYGEEMGLGKPWEPDWSNKNELKYCIENRYDKGIHYDVLVHTQKIFAFPTEEMRDAFYDNFKELIESCKELL